jgi:hypothetical protein
MESVVSNVKRVKTRHLSLCQYLKRLQLEYIVAELRKKIYPLKGDQLFYENLMVQKRKTIEDISKRNYLPNIFNDDNLRQELYDTIHPEFGFPLFLYRDESHRIKYEPLDKKYYYYQNTEFRVLVKDKVEIVKLESVNLEDNSAVILFNGNQLVIATSNIARIL